MANAQAQAAGSGRVTIADLARALDLTKGTVSRALNDYPDISDATRLRVRRMAERMGYAPLSHAQAIRTGRARALGLVVQMGDHDAHRPFLADFLAGISEAASAEGWTLTVAAADSDASTLDVMRALVRDRKADGFILPRTRLSDGRVDLLRSAAVPFVMFGRTGDPAGCAWYDILGEAAMAGAVAHLAGLGHRRIGFLNSDPAYTYAGLRAEGFARGMADAGLPVDPAICAEGARTRDEAARGAAAILDADTPPTAIVAATDVIALGLYRAAAARGLVIGRDLSVTGYDGIPEAAAAQPPLTTFAVDHRRAGGRLARLLIRRIRGEPPEALRETECVRLAPGGSSGPPAT